MVMGLPDTESTEKGAPGDTQIIHFEQDPICIKSPPSPRYSKWYLLSSGNYILGSHHGPARYRANIMAWQTASTSGTMAWVTARESNTGAWQLPWYVHLAILAVAMFKCT